MRLSVTTDFFCKLRIDEFVKMKDNKYVDKRTFSALKEGL